MDLTPEQKAAVSEWIAGGASIAEVQKRLREEHQISLTFMDTRFLIDDLNLELVKPEPKKPAAADPASTPPQAAGENPTEADDAFADEPTGGGKLRVEIDRITRPGTVVSGSVVFSDGKTGKWALDQTGRLVFEPAEKGYRPSEADLQQFQQELSVLLQKQGF